MEPLTALQRNMMRRATIGDQLRRHARTHRDKPHIINYDIEGRRTEYSYGRMNRLSCRFANALTGLGIRKGDLVAVMSHNSPHYAMAWFGCTKIGAILSGISFMYVGEEIAYQVNHSEAKVLVVEGGLTDRVDAIRDKLPGVKHYICSNLTGTKTPGGWIDFEALISDTQSDAEPEVEIADEDVAFMTYTSGTEAKPKGALIQHRNYFSSTTPSFLMDLGWTRDEVALFMLPFYTIGGLGTYTTLGLIGATVVLPYQVDASLALRIIEEEKATFIGQTPTFFLKMMQEPGFDKADLTAVRSCLTFAALLSTQVLDAWNQKAPNILWTTYWGQSELSQLGTVGKFKTLEDVPGGDPSWIGKPVATLEVRVVDVDGNDMAPGEPGELVCRSPSTMLGYYKDPEKTADVFQGGWVHTGDIVRMDEEGNLFFFDRKKDMIKTGGMNVSSFDVEDAIYKHSGVAEVAVVGVQDPYWAEIVAAAVVPHQGKQLSEEEIKQTCKERLAAYKVPKKIFVVDQLPKDPAGKILKREIRKNLTENLESETKGV